MKTAAVILITLFTALFFCHFDAIAQRTAAERKQPETIHPVNFLGSFYYERFTEEHVYQGQIDLWQVGSKVFGLYAFTGGLQGDAAKPHLIRFSGTYREETKGISLRGEFTSFTFRGRLKGDVLSGRLKNMEDLQENLSRSTNKLGTRAEEAPMTSYEDWVGWAERRLDEEEAKNPQQAKEIQACDWGEGKACLRLGNGANHRGKKELARSYWRRACALGAWAGCRFIGDVEAYSQRLHEQCRAEKPPSLDRNFACTELGETEEKAGRVSEAKQWYRLGCNKSVPMGACMRLEKLSFTADEEQQLEWDCAGNDLPACFILAAIAQKRGRVPEARDLYQKACAGVTYACNKQ